METFEKLSVKSYTESIVERFDFFSKFAVAASKNVESFQVFS